MDGRALRRNRRRWLRTCAAGGLALGLCVGAQARPIDNARVGLPLGAQPLAAAVLTHLRGRFEANDEITYFGLEMLSHWIDGAGKGVTVGTNIALSLSGSHPLSINSYAQNSGSGVFENKSIPNRQISGNPLSSVSGVGQSIQVVGDDNTVQNDSIISVTTGSGTIAGSSGTVDVTDHAGGATGKVTVINDTVTVGINVPGQGFVQQTIGAQGLAQSAQVLSDANNILNQMSLDVGFNAVKGVSGIELNEILSSLHGL